jgi:AAHS family 4-hydroxybenzoate transporter-like MFS transporter
MKNKQMLYLFTSSLVILFIGMGLFPLLPLYAAQFGATRTVVGVYFALIYVANAAGPMLTGWLAARLTRRRLFVVVGALGIPALALLGQATALWQVILLTAIVWFCGGVGLTLVSVFTGLHADNGHRGKSFSLTFLAFPLGAVFGGATVTALVTQLGYATMFLVLAAVWTILPLIGILGLKDKPASRPVSSAMAKSSRPRGDFYLLLLVSLLSGIAVAAGRLGAPLSMQALGFSTADIVSTATVGGLVTIPIALLIGALSDRQGRGRFLILCYLLAAAAAVILSNATQVWHFWLAAILTQLVLCTNGALASALATDWIAPETLSRGLPWINTMQSIASIVSFAGVGYIMDTLGATPLYLAVMALALIAALQFIWLQRRTQRRKSVATDGPGVSGVPESSLSAGCVAGVKAA